MYVCVCIYYIYIIYIPVESNLYLLMTFSVDLSSGAWLIYQEFHDSAPPSSHLLL